MFFSFYPPLPPPELGTGVSHVCIGLLPSKHQSRVPSWNQTADAWLGNQNLRYDHHRHHHMQSSYSAHQSDLYKADSDANSITTQVDHIKQNGNPRQCKSKSLSYQDGFVQAEREQRSGGAFPRNQWNCHLHKPRKSVYGIVLFPTKTCVTIVAIRRDILCKWLRRSPATMIRNAWRTM